MKNLIVLLILVCGINVSAQVAINTDGSAPDNSAMLDVKSTSTGMLVPRMTSAQRMAIINPANGLMVYQTDGVIGFYYYTSTSWQCIGETDGSETKVTAGTNVAVTGTGTIANPYVINASEGGSSSSHYIGELFGGGIVFWVDNTGQHGLIVCLVELGIAQWSTEHPNTGAISLWNGQGNSAIILGVSPAASICDGYINSNYGTGIYADWYLPAIDQLNLIYDARYILNKNIEGVSGADIVEQLAVYWSSTEYTYWDAWCFRFVEGTPYSFEKIHNLTVRAVRSF